jgi:DNA-binding transcriptional ArsR family regulator
MPRLKTTYDVFSAIGEPKRRQILDQLVKKEMTVNQLSQAFDWPQPMVSKHLGVLKEVCLVSERRMGRYRFYKVEPDKLKPIHQWMHQFEKYWGGALDQLDEYLINIQKEGKHK